MEKIGLEAVLKMAGFVKGAAQYVSGITKMEDTTKKSTGAMESAWLKWNAATDLVQKGMQSLKKVMEFGREGAIIDQTTQSFNRLMDSMGVGPDVLRDMSNATNNTVDDMTLMSSTMTLLAGTSDELGRSMVEAAPQLLEIAKAANKLNPTLGDTAFLYQSLATGIKRSSPLILDNLGLTIKVGEANQAWADKMGIAVEAMSAEDKQMALLEATIKAGDRMIQQAGGSTESMADAFARADTQIKNATNEIKMRMAPAVAGLTTAFANLLVVLSGGMTDQLLAMAQAGIDAGDSLEKLARAANKAKVVARVGEDMKLFWIDQSEAIDLTADELIKLGEEAGSTAEEIYKVADSLGISFTDRERGRLEDYRKVLAYTHEEMRLANIGATTLTRTTEEFAAATANASEWAKRAAEAIVREGSAAEQASAAFKAQLDILHSAISGPVGKAFTDLSDKIRDLRTQLAEGKITHEEYTSALDNATEAFKRNTNAIIFNIAEKQILDALEKGLIDDVNASGSAYDEATIALYALAEGLGLVDEGTLALTRKVLEQTDAYIAGQTPLSAWISTMGGLSSSMADAALRANDLTAAINGIPSYKRVVVEYYQSGGEGPPPELGIPEEAGPPPGNIMQHGGPVSAGEPYLVGEAGPEMFVPDTAGQIIPNNWAMNLPALLGAVGGGGGAAGSPAIQITMNPTINTPMDMAEFEMMTERTVQRALRGA